MLFRLKYVHQEPFYLNPSTWPTPPGFRLHHLHLNFMEDLQSQTRHDLPGEYKTTKSTSRVCGCLLSAAEQTIIAKSGCEQENIFCINFHVHYYLDVKEKKSQIKGHMVKVPISEEFNSLGHEMREWLFILTQVSKKNLGVDYLVISVDVDCLDLSTIQSKTVYQSYMSTTWWNRRCILPNWQGTLDLKSTRVGRHFLKWKIPAENSGIFRHGKISESGKIWHFPAKSLKIAYFNGKVS